MGFYGNITSATKTQFAFDRTYPNRHIMDVNAKKDGVYLGRYVLVEYDVAVQPYLEHQVEAGDDYLRVYCKNYSEENINNLLFYTSATTQDESTRLKWTDIPAENNPHHGQGRAVLEGQIVWILVDANAPQINNKDEYRVFFQCTGKTKENDYAVLTRVVNEKVKDHYVENFNIDMEVYGKGRGFDSTVWQKVYTNDVEKYVMIAELNSVVPTFDLDVDAPTMSPLTPHFDTDSTSVYYKLHWQPQWGLRVSKQEDIPSDSETIWIKETYDTETDIKTKWYWHEKDGEWKAYEDEDEIISMAAAIHFNKIAFDPQVKSDRKTVEGINKHYSGTDDDVNYFTIMPTGVSGDTYNAHDGTGKRLPAEDIQEMRINLPAIGNMMSDAWDIIHGPLRNDDKREFRKNNDGQYLDKMNQITENKEESRVDSLQGRLDSIAELKIDEIPIKRSSDGELVGTRINGNKNFSFAEDDEIREILWEEVSDSFDMDDPWISTTINTERIVNNHTDKNEKGEYVGNNGISIHHTYYPTKDSTSSIDVNSKTADGSYSKETSETYKKDNILNSNLDSDGNTINLYSPYVDATGHVVGKNIETITLPYAYKTFKTENGVSLEEEQDLFDAGIGESTFTTADNTQDSLMVDPFNKWIQTKFSEDKLEIAHTIDPIDIVDADDTNLNDEDIDNIVIQDIQHDAAGHIISNKNHKYVLPYSFKTIQVSNSNDNPHPDAYREWNDNIIVGTELPAKADSPHDILGIKSLNKNIKIYTANSYYSLPPSLGGGSKNSVALYVEHDFPAPSLFNSNLKSNNNISPKFGDSFNVSTFGTDGTGHVGELGEYAIILPTPSLNDLTATGASVLTGISMVPETGAITQTNANVGSLLLTGYPVEESDEQIAAKDSINEAFGKLQNQLNNEIDRATKAEAEVLSDAKAYTDDIKEALLGEGIKDTFDTLVEIQNWIEGDGVNTAELTSAIATETDRAKDKENELSNSLTSLQKVAITQDKKFIYWEKEKIETDENGEETTVIEKMEYTIEELVKHIKTLEDRIAQLEGNSEATE